MEFAFGGHVRRNYRPCAAADHAISLQRAQRAPGTQWVAEEDGFFKKHDIDPEVLFIVGGRVISQAMFAGELPMGLSSMAALLQANAAGGDLTYVAYFGSKTDYALFSTKEITDVKQLRGKRLGIGQFGGGPDFASRIVLEKHGLIPDKDVRIVQMLVPDSGRLAALQAGVIESILLPAPTSLRAMSLGFKQLLDYSTELLFPLASLTTTRAYIRQSPAVVKRIVEERLDAVRFIFSKEDATLKILAKYTKIDDSVFLREYHRKIILHWAKRARPNARRLSLSWMSNGRRNALVRASSKRKAFSMPRHR